MSSLPAFVDSGLPAPGASVRVRAARIRDWSRLQGLMCRLFPQVDEATFGHWLRDERHNLAVAMTSEGVVGMVRLEVQPGSRTTQLALLGVDPSARGQGVAKALLAYCGEVACACGAPTLQVDVASDDDAAQGLFRRLGYEVVRAASSAQVEGRLRLARSAPAPVWPTWDLKRQHAPRVPPAALHRLAMRALYGAWLGSVHRNGRVSTGAHAVA